MSDLEQTQAIFLDDYEEETDEDISKEKQIVSHLKVLCQKGFPERKFPLYEGDNIIGRQEDACNIAIPLKALSREHACIEIRGDSHLIYDKGSRNKTKRNKLYLTPEVRYELKDNDTLTFGDVTSLYLIGGDLKDDGSGSETESESEFQTAPPASIKPATSIKADSTNQKEVPTTLVYESDEGSDSDQSVDLLQPTQAFPNNQNGSSLLKLADDSDEETELSKSAYHNVTVKDTPAPPRRTGRDLVTVEESGSETEGEEQDDRKDDSREENIMMAPTQAFVKESDNDETDIEASPVRKHLLVAETQSFIEGDKDKHSETQTFIQDSDTDDEEDEFRKMQAAATQAFPSVLPSDLKKSEIPVTEVEIDDDEDETDDEDVSHLLANPTMACDVEIDADATENDATQEFSADLVTDIKGKKRKHVVNQDEEATQAIFDATVAVADDATVAVADDATQCFDDATVAITDVATQAVAMPSAKGKSSRNEEAATQVFDEDGAPQTVVVAMEEEECSDDIAARLTDGETLAVDVCVTGKEEDDKTCEDQTQVFDDPTQKCDDATQVFGDPTQKCDDATQVFDDPTLATEAVMKTKKQLNRKSARAKESTQIVDDATQIVEDSTDAVVKSSKPTKGARKNKNSRANSHVEEDATQVMDDATQVFDDPTLSVENLTKQGRGRNKGKIEDDATQVMEDATQVFDDPALPVENLTKQGRGRNKGRNKGKIEDDATQVMEDATQVFDDPALPVENLTKQVRGRNKGRNKGKIEDDATQVMEDATQVFDDPTLPVETITSQAKGGKKGRNKVKIEDVTPDDATQVFDDPTLSVESTSKQAKGGRRNKGKEKQAKELEATQVFDDPTLAVDDVIQLQSEAETKKLDEQDATQVFDDATVAIADMDMGTKPGEEATQVFTDQTVALSDNTETLPGTSTFTPTNVNNDETQSFGEDVNDSEHAGIKSDQGPIVADESKPKGKTRGRKSKVTEKSEEDNNKKETSQKAEIDQGTTQNPHGTRGRGRKAAKTTAEVKDSVSDTSQVEVPKGRRGRGRKSEAASTSAIVNNETQIADDECTPPLDNDNEEEEVEDIQTSPPRHGKKRGRSSTSATTTAPVGRGKRAKTEDKKKEDQTSTENNSETRGRRGRKTADKGESVEEDVKAATAKKGKTRKTPESPKKNEVLEATQPYIDGSTVPEATQIYDMEINDEPEATQAYAMDVQDEDSDTTPPVSDVLGVPVVEGEPTRPIPMDSDEVVPPSHSSEDSNLRSPLVPIPSRSPYKSALASPKKEKKSPSPKRVMFAKRDSEKSLEDSESTKIVSKKSVEDSNSTKGNVRQSSRAIQKKGAKTDSSSEVNNTTVDSTNDKGVGVTKGRGGRGRKSLPAPTPPNKETATKTRGRRSALPAVMEVDSSMGSKGDSQEATTSSTSSLSVVDDTGDQTKGKVNRRTRGSTVTEKEEVKKSGKTSSDTTKQDSDKVDDAVKSDAKTEALETSKVATTGRRGGKKSNITETSVKEESTGNKSNMTETSVKETSTENDEECTTTKHGRGRRKGKVSDSRRTSEETSSQGVSQEETSAKTEPSSKAPPRKGRASSVSSDVNTSAVTVKKEGRGKGKKMESESEDSQQSVTSVDSTEGKRGRSQTRKGAAVKESSVDPLPTGKGQGRVSRSSASSQDDSMDTGSDRSTAAKRKRKGEEENSQQSKKTKMEPPATPKTTKTTASISSPSLRRTSLDPSKPKVMFTGVVDEQGQKIVKDLGGELVTSMSDCTHLVTDKVRRTVKFLCCLSRGIPIVTPTWLNSSKSAAMFIDATPFLVKDPATEKQYRFSLQTSIDKARESSLLQGYKIHVTKSVRPEPAQMKDIVLSAGAEFLATIPKKSNDKTVVISCQDDRTVCEPALKTGIPIVNAEFILTGILRQEVDLSSLFDEKNGSKRGRDSSVGDTTQKRRK